MADELTQKGRLLTVKTPLADDVLLPDRMSLSEGLSQLFVLGLDLIAPLDKADQVDSKSLLGQPMTLSVALAEKGEKRHINGIISRFVAGPRDARVATYRAEIVPQLWLLSLKSNCRVFQDKSVPDILNEVL
jgi:type VI secretion system secreted protein VgrG